MTVLKRRFEKQPFSDGLKRRQNLPHINFQTALYFRLVKQKKIIELFIIEQIIKLMLPKFGDLKKNKTKMCLFYIYFSVGPLSLN